MLHGEWLDEEKGLDVVCHEDKQHMGYWKIWNKEGPQLNVTIRTFEGSHNSDDQTKHATMWDLLVPPKHNNFEVLEEDVDFSKGLGELLRRYKPPSYVPLANNL